jgi:hypothetical protein
MRSPQEPVSSQINLAHIFTIHFLKIHVNTLHLSMTGFLTWPLHFWFSKGCVVLCYDAYVLI